MDKNYAKDLFHLQSELIDTKVDMATSKAIDRVIEKINDFRAEFHDFRHEVNDRFNAVNDRFNAIDKRVVAIETKLGMVAEAKKDMSNRVLDYTFKAGWGFLTFFFAYLIVKFHIFVT